MVAKRESNYFKRWKENW